MLNFCHLLDGLGFDVIELPALEVMTFSREAE